MKLYATTTSERGKRSSKGGNEFLKIELSLKGGEIDAGDIELINKNDIVEVLYISQSGFCTTLARFDIK